MVEEEEVEEKELKAIRQAILLQYIEGPSRVTLFLPLHLADASNVILACRSRRVRSLAAEL